MSVAAVGGRELFWVRTVTCEPPVSGGRCGRAGLPLGPRSSEYRGPFPRGLECCLIGFPFRYVQIPAVGV